MAKRKEAKNEPARTLSAHHRKNASSLIGKFTAKGLRSLSAAVCTAFGALLVDLDKNKRLADKPSTDPEVRQFREIVRDGIRKAAGKAATDEDLTRAEKQANNLFSDVLGVYGWQKPLTVVLTVDDDGNPAKTAEVLGKDMVAEWAQGTFNFAPHAIIGAYKSARREARPEAGLPEAVQRFLKSDKFLSMSVDQQQASLSAAHGFITAALQTLANNAGKPLSKSDVTPSENTAEATAPKPTRKARPSRRTTARQAAKQQEQQQDGDGQQVAVA